MENIIKRAENENLLFERKKSGFVYFNSKIPWEIKYYKIVEIFSMRNEDTLYHSVNT